MKLENATRFDRTKNYLLSKPRSILETNARPRFQFSAKRSVSDREIGIIGATNERSVESALKAGGGGKARIVTIFLVKSANQIAINYIYHPADGS